MSITQIAKEAGVSITTVSRFFNDPNKVAESTARRIRRVVDRNDYRPDARRPGPKTIDRVGIRSFTVVFLALGPFSPERMMSAPAFPFFLGALQSALSARKISLTMAHLLPNGEIPPAADPKYCDGLILFDRPQEEKTRQALRNLYRRLPTVWSFRDHCDDLNEVDHVFYDNSVIGVMAADYFAKRGHRKVVLFNVDAEHRAFRERVETFALKCAELGIEVVRCETDLTVPYGTIRYRKLAERFLEEKDGVTGAFFCADDVMLGVTLALQQRGFQCSHLDFLGVNADDAVFRFLSPRPATIDIKMDTLGKITVEQLLKRIAGTEDESRTEIYVKPELIPCEEAAQ